MCKTMQMIWIKTSCKLLKGSIFLKKLAVGWSVKDSLGVSCAISLANSDIDLFLQMQEILLQNVEYYFILFKYSDLV